MFILTSFTVAATLSAVHQINTDSMQVHQSIPTTPSGSNVGMSASCNASPRPSILRKRNVDGYAIFIVVCVCLYYFLFHVCVHLTMILFYVS